MEAIAWTILLFAASTYLLRGMMRLLDLTAGWPRFFALGCLSNLAVFIGAGLCGFLLGCRGSVFGGVAGGGGGAGGGWPDAPRGFEGALNALSLFSLAFFVIPILPIGVWMIGVAALKVAAKVAADLEDMADDEGNKADRAGKRKFFLDKDE